jgi:hypothetical protein
MDSLSSDAKTILPMIIKVDDVYSIQQLPDMLVDGVSKPVFFITLTDRLTFKFIGRVRDFASELKKYRHVIDGTYKGNI